MVTYINVFLSEWQNKYIGLTFQSLLILFLIGFYPGLILVDLNGQTQPDPAYLNFTSKPLGTITAITSDKDGFIWISSGYGLYRYDGTNYIPLEELMKDPPPISTTVNSLYVDKFNQLWVFKAAQGLYRIDLHSFKWKCFDALKFRKATNFNLTIWEDKTLDILVPYERGFARYLRTQDTFSTIEIDVTSPVRLIAGYYDNQLVLATGDKIYLYDFQKQKTTEIKSLENTSWIISYIELDPYGHLWVANWNRYQQSLVRYNFVDSTIRVFALAGNEQFENSSTDIWQMKSTNEHMYFATQLGGFWSYNYQEDKLRRIELKKNYRISDINQLRSIHIDHYNRIWLGTTVDVLHETLYNKEIKHIGNRKDQTLFPSNDIYTVTALTSDELAIGTDQGLAIYDIVRGTSRMRSLPLFNDNSYNNIVRHIVEDGDYLWVMTWAGIMHIRKDDLSIEEQYVTFLYGGKNHPPAMLKPDIGAVVEARITKDGSIWMINNSTTVIRMNGTPHHREIRKYQLIHDSVAQTAKSLEYDPIWGLIIASDQALWRYDSLTDSFLRCVDFISNRPLERGELDLALNNNHELFLLTMDTLYELLNHEDQYQLVKIGHPDRSHNLNYLIFDRQNTAWMTSKRGLLRWDYKADITLYLDNEMDLYGTSFDRMPPVVKNTITPDNQLFIATNNGLLEIDLDSFKINPSPPELLITSLIINGNHVDADRGQLSSQISLPYNQNNIQIFYSMLNDEGQVTRQYSYRINQQDWIPVGNQSNISLSGLAPGRYIFEVNGRSSDGVLALAPKTLIFKIRAPWYGTRLAYGAYLLFVGLILYSLYRFRLSTLMAKKEALRIKELDQFKNQFFTNITHELRTPLTVISGMARKIEEQPIKWTKRGTHLIRKNSATLLKLINEILDLSRLEQGMSQQKMIQGDVIAYLKYLTESFHSSAEINHQFLHFDSNCSELMMDFDKETIRGIMSNLISNAIKFSEEGSVTSVHVSADESGKLLTIEVSDQGIGIHPDHLPQIFNRYYQVKNETAGSPGSGIGLALTRELVNLAGGSIIAQSQLGEGTKFTLWLPITRHAAFESSAIQPDTEFIEITEAKNPDAKVSILIVEDNPEVSEYIQSCLDQDYHCHLAVNGKEGLEKAISLIPDLIISDIMMPIMDGTEMLHNIRGDQRIDHIPVIMLTAKTSVQDRIQGIEQGADAYLGKPFEERELLAHVKNLLTQRNRLRSKYREANDTDKLSPAEIRNQKYLDKLRTIIFEHLDDVSFGVEELSQSVHLSARQLNRKLKAISDFTVNQLIRSVRIDRAKKMLKQKDKTITEISMEVGFSSPQYFATVFKEEVGMSPGEYAGG